MALFLARAYRKQKQLNLKHAKHERLNYDYKNYVTETLNCFTFYELKQRLCV